MTRPIPEGYRSVNVILTVDDAAKAIDAGGTQTMPVENQFWGDRMGGLTDPFGHKWSIATHVEDVPESEFPARMAEFTSKQKQAETV